MEGLGRDYDVSDREFWLKATAILHGPISTQLVGEHTHRSEP